MDIKSLRVPYAWWLSQQEPWLVAYQAGGGRHSGLQVEAVSQYNRVLTGDEIKKLYNKGKKRKQKRVDIGVFLNNTSILIQGTSINHAELIKYVCNKLGGAHYDSHRKDSPLEEKYKLLDKYRNEHQIAWKDAVYFELLSIGQKLVNSRDIQKLQKNMKNILQQQ